MKDALIKQLEVALLLIDISSGHLYDEIQQYRERVVTLLLDLKES